MARDFCTYCGALAVSELKKKHLRNWLQRHTNWNHNTQRNMIASVKAAFNYCCKYDDPLREALGKKNPKRVAG